MKENLGGRKLDKLFCVGRMDHFEAVFYNTIRNFRIDSNDAQESVIDKFIETCVSYDMIVREHLYYPKR